MTRGQQLVSFYKDVDDDSEMTALASMVDALVENAISSAYGDGKRQAENDASWHLSKWGQ